MAETKEEIAAERDELRQALDAERAKTAELQQKLGTVGAVSRPANPEPRFELSEGERLELQTQGFTRSVRNSGVILATDYPDLVDVGSLSPDARERMERAGRERDVRESGALARDGLPRDVPADRDGGI